MRWKLSTNKNDADQFAGEVQALIAATNPAIPVVKKAVWIEHLQRWAVKMEIEPVGVAGEIVESVEPPVELGME